MVTGSVAGQQLSGEPEDGAPGPGRVTARRLRELMADDMWLDELIDSAQQGGVRLTGDGGFLPEMIKAVLERGLAAELTGHLGYEQGDPAGRGSPNSRNGTTPKTVSTEIGPVPLDVPRDRASTFEPRLVPKGQRRLGGLDGQIISLYAGGMTVRDIQTHLARTAPTKSGLSSPQAPPCRCPIAVRSASEVITIQRARTRPNRSIRQPVLTAGPSPTTARTGHPSGWPVCTAGGGASCGQSR